jgi:hypothetical protein
MWAAVLPIDTAKTRVQLRRPGAAPRSLAAELAAVARARGARGLWAGLGPTLARAAPANAAQWLAWEACAQW